MSITSNRVFAAVAAASVAVAGLAAPAFAEDVRTVTVNYKDLNLQSAAGQKQLARRIATAADMVCTQPSDGLSTRNDENDCKTAAKSRANAELTKVSLPGA